MDERTQHYKRFEQAAEVLAAAVDAQMDAMGRVAKACAASTQDEWLMVIANLDARNAQHREAKRLYEQARATARQAFESRND